MRAGHLQDDFIMFYCSIESFEIKPLSSNATHFQVESSSTSSNSISHQLASREPSWDAHLDLCEISDIANEHHHIIMTIIPHHHHHHHRSWISSSLPSPLSSSPPSSSSSSPSSSSSSPSSSSSSSASASSPPSSSSA